MGKLKIAFIIVLILLILAVTYIGIVSYNKYKLGKDQELYTQGAIFGYSEAVSQVYEEAQSCKEIPVSYNNNTIPAAAWIEVAWVYVSDRPICMKNNFLYDIRDY